MAKYKVIRFADNERGIGAEVEKKKHSLEPVHG